MAMTRQYEELKTKFHAAKTDAAKEAVLSEMGPMLGQLYLLAREIRMEMEKGKAAVSPTSRSSGDGPPTSTGRTI